MHYNDFQSTDQRKLKDVARVLIGGDRRQEMDFIFVLLVIVSIEAATGLQCYQCKSPVIEIWKQYK